MKPVRAYQKSAECSDGVSRGRGKDIFQKSTQAQQKIDERVRECIKKCEESVEVRHVLLPFKGIIPESCTKYLLRLEGPLYLKLVS